MAHRSRAFLLTVALWLSPLPAAAQLIYVAEGVPGVTTSDTQVRLHLVNSATQLVLQTISLGSAFRAAVPDVVVSPDGLTLYVSANKSVVVIDAATLAVTHTIPALQVLGKMVRNADGSRLYVVGRGGDTITVIDTVSKQVTGSLVLLPGPASDIVLSPDEAKLYAAREDANSVAVINLVTRAVETSWTTAARPTSIGVHPDGSRVYVVDLPASGFHVLTAFDPATGNPLGTLQLASVPGRSGDMTVLSSGRIYLPRSASRWVGPAPLQFVHFEMADIIDGASLTLVTSVAPAGSGGGLPFDNIRPQTAVLPDEALVFTLGSRGLGTIDSTTFATAAKGPSVSAATGIAVASTPPCWLELPPRDLVFRQAGGSKTLAVNVPAGCPSEIVAADPWITVQGTTINVGASSEPRRTSISAGGQTRAILQVIERIEVDSPIPGAEVTLPFQLSGWAIERDSVTPMGDGVAVVTVTDLPPGGGVLPIFNVSSGESRPDVAAVYGTRFGHSGFAKRIGRLAAGTHTFRIAAVSSLDAAANEKQVTFTVRRTPQIVIDQPASGNVSQPFKLSGWAADTTVPTGSGVDQVHVWAYPQGGGAPLLLGALESNLRRDDVAALFNEPGLQPGFEMTVSSLPRGRYTVVAYAHCVATNSFDAVATVDLSVDNPLAPVPPFGSLDTPLEASLVSGAVQVTGWALDDSLVTRIAIYRDAVAGEFSRVYLGDATFVEGARPDVAAFFPSYPHRTRAGWGLSVLTNLLPIGGRGNVTFSAEAHDAAGNITLLGRRTVFVDNIDSPWPFGTIDTPGQGETVSGTILNWGWALTPSPGIIPTDGSTIDVLIDGIVVGHPVYGLNRADIAAVFAGYANTNSAVGYFVIDTTTLTNGPHTIAWVVRDNHGRVAGLGSRFFFVQNP